MQDEIMSLQQENRKEFWTYVGNIGAGKDRKAKIPMAVKLDDGTISTDHETVLNKWQSDYCNLLNGESLTGQPQSVPPGGEASEQQRVTSGVEPQLVDTGLEETVTVREVKLALARAKNGKAKGFDDIPTEIVKNETAIGFLHVLFNKCFDSALTPDIWCKGIINPIPKDASKDQRVPLNYRGITLASCVYKLYCSVLNNRLTQWAEANHLIEDEQNGFRKDRSCIDQLSTLTSLIETRRQMGLSTFVGFIDFAKAYDHIDRSRLWNRLQDIGMPPKFLAVLKSLYSNVECAVRINGHLTNWFPVNLGLKQGCILSPSLFNIYIDGLVKKIKASGVGIDIGDHIISVLLYADDLALISESEEDLQSLLNILYEWSNQWEMSVNLAKTKVVHFRRGPSTKQTNFEFLYGESGIEVTSQYRYLGLILTEFMDYNVTAKSVAQAAHRALGLLIAKDRAHGGMPYHVFSKLFDALVQPIIDYGASIWGKKTYTCIQTVQNRAMRYFLGVGRRTPVAALQGEMGWTTSDQRQWMCVTRHWCRLANLDANHSNNVVFVWAHGHAVRGRKNGHYHTMKFYEDIGMNHLANISTLPVFSELKDDIKTVLFEHYEVLWYAKLSRESAVRGNGRNKLRTYRMFKNSIETEPYVSALLPKGQRSALAKVRCGVAPLRIETGRFSGTPEDERLCTLCNTNEIENELHVLTQCEFYNDIRENLYMAAHEIDNNFHVLTNSEKMCFLVSQASLVNRTAKACQDILKRRSVFIFRS